MEAGVPVSFRPRLVPLAPVAAAGRGPAARALAIRLLARDDEGLAKLAGVAGPGLLLVLGAVELLPWVDGVSYLGRDPAAPSLLLPTALEPSVPLPLLERALLAREGGVPLAVLLDPEALVDAGGARPIFRATLAEWLASEAAPA